MSWYEKSLSLFTKIYNKNKKNVPLFINYSFTNINHHHLFKCFKKFYFCKKKELLHPLCGLAMEIVQFFTEWFKNEKKNKFKSEVLDLMSIFEYINSQKKKILDERSSFAMSIHFQWLIANAFLITVHLQISLNGFNLYRYVLGDLNFFRYSLKKEEEEDDIITLKIEQFVLEILINHSFTWIMDKVASNV